MRVYFQSGQPTTVTQAVTQATKTVQVTSSGETHPTIIQPSQAPQQFIVTSMYPIDVVIGMRIYKIKIIQILRVTFER